MCAQMETYSPILDELSAQAKPQESLGTSVLLTVKMTVMGKDRDQLWTGHQRVTNLVPVLALLVINL